MPPLRGRPARGLQPHLSASCSSTPTNLLNTPTTSPPPPPRTQDGVQEHFESLSQISDYRPNAKSSYSCIDSRGEAGIMVRRPARGKGGGDRPAHARSAAGRGGRGVPRNAEQSRRRSGLEGLARAGVLLVGARHPIHSTQPTKHQPTNRTNNQGTPGGDFSELNAGIQAYYDLTGGKVTEDGVDKIFNAFMAEVITKDRPFYYHTSDEKLHKIFHHLSDGGMKPKPTVLPTRSVS
jgi:hypothetical protein